MKIDDITQASLLYDFYGQLLSKRQSQVMELYHEENLSLSEIASEFNISRQGVHDALKNAEKALSEYERKLGLVEKFRKSSDAVSKIDRIIDSTIDVLLYENTENTVKAVEDLRKVKDIIDKLEE
ncbi:MULTISPECIES: YlxM family DNA-binding protein [Lentihominibacter]|nr:YlxM family DNA-binding protein [Lentihominibacter hominis]